MAARKKPAVQPTPEEVDPLFADQIPPHAPGTTTSTPVATADAEGHLPKFKLS